MWAHVFSFRISYRWLKIQLFATEYPGTPEALGAATFLLSFSGCWSYLLFSGPPGLHKAFPYPPLPPQLLFAIASRCRAASHVSFYLYTGYNKVHPQPRGGGVILRQACSKGYVYYHGNNHIASQNGFRCAPSRSGIRDKEDRHWLLWRKYKIPKQWIVLR